jgi:NDP-sugar pyrophosphorylase family protein
VLAPVHDRPFVTYLLDQLVESSIRDVVLCTGFRGDLVQETLGTRYGPLDLSYSHELEPLGTGGALRHALPLLHADPVVVLNGDSYCDVDVDHLLTWYARQDAAGALVLAPVADAGRYGRVATVGSRISAFREKPDGEKSAGARRSRAARMTWISAGVYVLATDVIASIPSGRAVSLEREVFPAWVGRGLCGYRAAGRFLDIGTPASYARADELFAGLGRSLDIGQI